MIETGIGSMFSSGAATLLADPPVVATAPTISQANADPQGDVTRMDAGSGSTLGANAIYTWQVDGVGGSVYSGAFPKTAGAAYTVRLKAVWRAAGYSDTTLYSNVLSVDALSITATTAPALAALLENETPASALSASATTPGNYSSNAGAIASAVAVYEVDGLSRAGSYVLSSGEQVEVTVTVTDTNSNVVIFAMNIVTVGAAAPVNTVSPTVNGSTSLGAVLSTTNGTWTGTGISYTYQWQRDTVDIAGATASSYIIAQEDNNASLRCVVTATNTGGAIAANSNAISVDNFATPVITGVPAIAGTRVYGNALTATAANVAGAPAPTRTWQWERNNIPIAGATSSMYVLASADVGATLTVVQTETNTNGIDTAESAATATIAAPTITDNTSPVMGALVDGSAINTESGADGVYSSDFPGETFVDGVSGASLAVEYQVDGGSWASGSASANTGEVIGKRVTVVGSAGTTGVFTTSTITASATGDATAPVLSNPAWNNATGVGSVTSDEAGTLHLCTYNSASGTPTASGAGWSGAPLETFSQAVSNGPNSLIFTDTALSPTATHFAYFVRDAAGNNSLVQPHAYTKDITGPVLVPASCTPADGATGIAINSNVTLVFDETVVAGSGNFYIYDTSGPTLIETIAVGAATIGTTDVVLNPTSDLSLGADYSVSWQAGVLEDASGNPVLANTSDTLLNFTTAATAATFDWQYVGTMTVATSGSARGYRSGSFGALSPTGWETDTFGRFYVDGTGANAAITVLFSSNAQFKGYGTLWVQMGAGQPFTQCDWDAVNTRYGYAFSAPIGSVWTHVDSENLNNITVTIEARP
jgi:hypothetical protein